MLLNDLALYFDFSTAIFKQHVKCDLVILIHRFITMSVFFTDLCPNNIGACLLLGVTIVYLFAKAV